ncbi:MFS transporter [Catenulispora pinisilvae]|uniref:MFS transporter n=1 Tax=Catenulispora pinisilvae TaxID=2705253 RepID=UPI0018911C3B|nr:MFS transporter [Catenulispora pinisilvae]
MTTTSIRPAECGEPAVARRSRPGRPGNPLSAFTGFPRAIWIVFAGTVVNRIGFLVGPFLVFFLGSRGIPSSQTPYVLGALGAGNLVGPAVGGWLADRGSRKLTMLTGLLGTAAAQGALFAAPNVATMALAAITLSATATMVSPAASATLADSVGPEQRREAFALIGWAVNIGTAVAGVLGGYLAAHGYWMLFAIDAGTSVGYAVIVAVLLPGQASQQTDAASEADAVAATASEDSSSTSSSSGYGVVLRDRLVRKLLPLLGVQLFIYSLTESALPLAIRTDGLSPSVMGLVAVVNAGLIVALQPVATTFLARFPRTPVYLVASTLIALGIALTGIAHSPAMYAATVVVWSLGEVAVGGIPGALIADLAPAHARGRYQGAFSWTWGVARFLALTAGTTVYTLIGPAFLWWSALGAGAAAIVGIATLGPAMDHRSAGRS